MSSLLKLSEGPGGEFDDGFLVRGSNFVATITATWRAHQHNQRAASTAAHVIQTKAFPSPSASSRPPALSVSNAGSAAHIHTPASPAAVSHLGRAPQSRRHPGKPLNIRTSSLHLAARNVKPKALEVLIALCTNIGALLVSIALQRTAESTDASQKSCIKFSVSLSGASMHSQHIWQLRRRNLSNLEPAGKTRNHNPASDLEKPYVTVFRPAENSKATPRQLNQTRKPEKAKPLTQLALERRTAP